MLTLLLLFLGQCVLAVVVVFILKNLLDRELMNAALEKFESCKPSSEVQEIVVCSASTINEKFKSQIESVRQRKFNQASFDFRRNVDLKGGVVLMVGDDLLDFSLSSRLQNFWS